MSRSQLQDRKYEIIVVGGGHAGCEASLAASRLGCKTLLLTMNLDTIAFMSCNPAVGGLAKGQLVKEIDALGGEMGKNTDATAIQFRRLNMAKGAAVRSSRAQVDRQAYRLKMKEVLEKQENLELKQALVEEILVDENKVAGVKTSIGEKFCAQAVIITPGTFLNGLIHIGLTNFPAGRMGDSPAIKLSDNLKQLGFRIGRFKTGTCPRLDGKTIDFSKLKIQQGDDIPFPFSFTTKQVTRFQLPCYITYTNSKTHQIIREGLDRSPLYTGIIKGTGVRYCPSIEDKVMKFPERERHQIFLEPEGVNTPEVYPNGLATSLPIDIQFRMLRSIEGLEKVEIMRPGYAIEHDYVDPTELQPTLETKLIKNLYFCGQINGTTGYEEAAAQGLIGGINAVLKIKNRPPFILDRSEAYIGVLIDDLVTKGTKEPYRMFTSRAEYRLILREDNVDLRLTEKAYGIGLIGEMRYQEVESKKRAIENELARLKEAKIFPDSKTNEKFSELGWVALRSPVSLAELLRRPGVSYSDLKFFDKRSGEVPLEVSEQAEIQIRYEGYIKHQEQEIEKFKKLENRKIPAEIDYQEIVGLSNEVREKLSKMRPDSLGRASRISGVTPAAIAILMVHMKRMGR
ncbi:tRNA uridine-5-carboxymethylaminomethyl(34) synthesis enzyme MnmG [bacterium]|nr:tRNA uridine-5-carboxymethylaminomethyl(34) synthesis enzyme MnmG [bacterium]NIN92034.1 tRNA uridine-5-carboxymethylaminomethyl(34) synthesis enzyme MnmG [bacterium]NIO18250.1 tRNA uridine-5-carboxymethylaminomethyl(34) synthesis enzyme MnmG [bacterium]NIO73224.1 tRNA uridine-5-carboxymethylaminomethyl(34) synthesis enzyme MnmG [bacterium]